MGCSEITLNAAKEVKSYLPFTDSPALAKIGDVLDANVLKLGSKMVLATAAAWTGVSLLSSFCSNSPKLNPTNADLIPQAAFAACQVLAYPLLQPAIALLSGGSVFLSEQKALDKANVQAFLQSASPSSKLMKTIFDSSYAMQKLLEKTAGQPSLLLKKNEFGKMILSEFIEKSRFKQNATFVEFGIAGPKALYSRQIEQNNQTLRQLLQAAPWPKNELVECIKSLSRRSPRTLDNLFKEGLLRKDELTVIEKVKLNVRGRVRKELKRGLRDFLGL